VRKLSLVTIKKYETLESRHIPATSVTSSCQRVDPSQKTVATRLLTMLEL